MTSRCLQQLWIQTYRNPHFHIPLNPKEVPNIYASLVLCIGVKYNVVWVKFIIPPIMIDKIFHTSTFPWHAVIFALWAKACYTRQKVLIQTHGRHTYIAKVCRRITLTRAIPTVFPFYPRHRHSLFTYPFSCTVLQCLTFVLSIRLYHLCFGSSYVGHYLYGSHFLLLGSNTPLQMWSTSMTMRQTAYSTPLLVSTTWLDPRAWETGLRWSILGTTSPGRSRKPMMCSYFLLPVALYISLIGAFVFSMKSSILHLAPPMSSLPTIIYEG